MVKIVQTPIELSKKEWTYCQFLSFCQSGSYKTIFFGHATRGRIDNIPTKTVRKKITMHLEGNDLGFLNFFRDKFVERLPSVGRIKCWIYGRKKEFYWNYFSVRREKSQRSHIQKRRGHHPTTKMEGVCERKPKLGSRS